MRSSMCYVKDYDFYIKADDSMYPSPGVCMRYYCNSNSMEVQEINYGYIAAIGAKERPCHVTAEDLTLYYPNCCPKLICKDSTIKCE